MSDKQKDLVSTMLHSAGYLEGTMGRGEWGFHLLFHSAEQSDPKRNAWLFTRSVGAALGVDEVEGLLG
jgi:hypothetical protein